MLKVNDENSRIRIQDPDLGSGSGSESISQKHGSEDPDPDPPQNVMDPEHWLKKCMKILLTLFRFVT
jgi:hypothetical protein